MKVQKQKNEKNKINQKEKMKFKNDNKKKLQKEKGVNILAMKNVNTVKKGQIDNKALVTELVNGKKKNEQKVIVKQENDTKLNVGVGASSNAKTKKNRKRKLSGGSNQKNKLKKFAGTANLDKEDQGKDDSGSNQKTKFKNAGGTANLKKDQVIVKKPKTENNKTALTPEKVAKNNLKHQKSKLRKLEKKKEFAALKEKFQAGEAGILKNVSDRIAALIADKTKSKTAKRRLRELKKLHLFLTNKESTTKESKADVKVARQESKLIVKNEQTKNKKNKKQKQKEAKIQQAKGKPTNAIKKEPQIKEEEESSSESDYNVEMTVKAEKVAKGMNEFEASSDEEIKTKPTVGKKNVDTKQELFDENEEDDEDDVENADEEDEESDGEEESEDAEDDSEDGEDENDDDDETEDVTKPTITKNVKAAQKNNKDVSSQNNKSKKQVRYVVFVGNLPYNTDENTIKEHFEKVGDVRDVRIPLEKNSKRQRGFAYVELSTNEQYEKALSMHHTFVGGRRINVLYTKGGKKKGDDQKKEIKAKNLKLKAMRDQGKLAGSKKFSQKRSVRRAKNNGPQKE